MCYVAGKKIFWSSLFYNTVAQSHYAEQMFLYYLTNIWKVKQNRLKKMLSHLAGIVRVHMENFHLTSVRYRQNQVRFQLGGPAHSSYEHIIFL